MPLHVLCRSPGHTSHSLQVCCLLNEAFPSGCQVRSERQGFLPLHFLCENSSLTPFSTQVAEKLLQGRGAHACRTTSNAGLTPLHHLCSVPLLSASQVVLASQLLERCPNAARMQGEAIFSFETGAVVSQKDKDLPLHRLCQAQPHTEYSVQVCQYLMAVHLDAIGTAGRQINDEVSAHYRLRTRVSDSQAVVACSSSLPRLWCAPECCREDPGMQEKTLHLRSL